MKRLALKHVTVCSRSVICSTQEDVFLRNGDLVLVP
jgi:hypothetical protein